MACKNISSRFDDIFNIWQLTNRRNMKVVCSHYLPVAFDGSGRVEGKVPCVVYLHGNSGCRMDADDFVDSFLIHRISVFSLDFTGCGMSDGEHVVRMPVQSCLVASSVPQDETFPSELFFNQSGTV